jgi:hypothetical protein
MKVWLVAIAFLVCACAGSANSDAQNAERGSDPQQKLKTPQDVEVRLAAVGDNSELAAKIEALEKRLAALEKQVKGQGSSGASVNAITMDDLENCIYNLLPLIKDAFNSLEVEHQSSILEHHPGHKVGAWGTLGLISMPRGCR